MPRAAATVASLAFAGKVLAGAPRGDGRPVLLIPGFANSDRSLFVLRRFLRRCGYEAQSWGLGRNFGARTVGPDASRLMARIRAFAEQRGPVTLVGVSLGGMLARLAALRQPETARQVITIASPYAADPRSTNVWRIYELLGGQKVSSEEAIEQLAEMAKPLPVPATAIWSPSDGLVNGHACYMPAEPGLDTIAIQGSHMAVQIRPRVLRAVADVLAGSGTCWNGGRAAAGAGSVGS